MVSTTYYLLVPVGTWHQFRYANIPYFQSIRCGAWPDKFPVRTTTRRASGSESGTHLLSPSLMHLPPSEQQGEHNECCNMVETRKGEVPIQ